MSRKIIHRNTSWFLMLGVVSLTACAPIHFEPADPIPPTIDLQNPQSEEISSNFFKLSDSKAVYRQDELDQNRTSVSFQVRLPDGTYLNDLASRDFTVIENGVPVTKFQLSSNSQQIVQTVDIVFAVDVTGSMSPTIESAKTRLINFVRTSRAGGYHTRMCLVTFGDYTIQHCNKFYDNNPQDPSTEAQVEELISDISKLKALTGSEDPGGRDFNENPMRALIDAAKAPWASNSQRFAILITDDGFLYSPGNSGAVGALAPRYTEVLEALAASQMKVFAATPSLAGYNRSFQGHPGVVEASQGEFFLFSDLIAGRITLDTILNRIISRVKTTYLVEYVADEIPGLDPSLPLKKREIEVRLANGQSATAVILSSQSNLPDGGAQYKKKWPLTDKKIKEGTLKVKINGVEIPFGFKVQAGELLFDLPPLRGAKIEVSFEYESMKDALQFAPIVLSPNEDLNALQIFFNGMKARGPDVSFERTLEGHWMVRPSESIFGEDDPFLIRQAGGLAIQLFRTKK